MKKYISIFSLLASLVFGTFITSCDVTNPMDNFVLTVDLPEESQVSLVIYDAATNELITEPVFITIIGEDADKAMDVAYEPTTGMETTAGFTSFLVNSNYIPTPEEPISYNLVVESDNYVSTSKLVTLESTGSSTQKIYLVSINNPPEGVAVQQNTSGNSDVSGATTNDIIVESNAGNNMQSSVSIPSGTVLTSSNGTPLNGHLTTTVSSYDGSVQGAANTIPQNLSVDGSIIDVISMISIQIMDEHGNVAGATSSLGKSSGVQNSSANITMKILYQAGLQLFAQTRGRIQNLASIGTVTINNDGAFFIITGPVDVLSNILSGFSYDRCYEQGETIRYNILKEDGSLLNRNDAQGNTVTYEYTKQIQNTPIVISGEASYDGGNETYYITLPNIGRTLEQFSLKIADNVVFQVQSTDICNLLYTIPTIGGGGGGGTGGGSTGGTGGGTGGAGGGAGGAAGGLATSFSWAGQQNQSRTYQDFKIITKCGNDKQVSLPQGAFTYQVQGGTQSSPITFSNGEFKIPNVQSAKYTITFSVSYESKTYVGKLVLDLTGWSENFTAQYNDLTSAIYDGKEYVGSTAYTYEVKNDNNIIKIVLTLSADQCDDLGLNDF